MTYFKPLRRSINFSLALTILASRVSAFNFTTPLAQCANITMSWPAGGVAPYEILLVPIGHLHPETRTIINYQRISPASYTSPPTTNASSPSVNDAVQYQFSFPLTLPAGSQFVAVLSDAEYGPGSGGTSPVLTVQPSPSGDDSCLSKTMTKPEFYFYVNTQSPAQCTPWDISWPQTVNQASGPSNNPSSNSPSARDTDPNDANYMSLWAIVPGVTTFPISLPSPPKPLQPTALGLDYTSWTVDVASGTHLMLVAGYTPSKGIPNARGKGGSTDILIVEQGGSGAGCLANDKPMTSAIPTLSGAPTGTVSMSEQTGTTTSTSGMSTMTSMSGGMGASSGSVSMTTSTRNSGASPARALSLSSIALAGIALTVSLC